MDAGGISLSTLDAVVVAVYLAGVVAWGVWVGRGKETAEDYFLAGRRLTWPLIGFSLYASNMSGASFVGLMGASYQHGMVVFNYEWTATFVLIVFALVMLPVFLRARLYTIPEYLERRFDVRSRRLYSAFTLAAILFIDTAGALYAGGVVITAAFPGLALWQASILLALLAGGYTIVGGLRSVVVTDTVQAILIIVGAAFILFVGLGEVGGWTNLTERLPEAKTGLFKPPSDPFLPWPGIFGVVLLGFYYWTLNQYIAQRALAAETLEAGRKGALFAGLLKLPNLALMIVPGLLAAALYPGLENPDTVFPVLAFELLPVGLRGLILTALLAAIMSSLDSALNAAASLATMDFVRPARPRTTDHGLMRIGRWLTAAIMVAAALYAPLIQGFGSLFAYFQATLSYLVPPVVAVFLVGLASRRVNRHGAFWALMSGGIVGLPLFLAQEVTGLWAWAALPPLHFTYVSIGMFALAVAILAGVSAATGGAAAHGRAAHSLTARLDDLRMAAESARRSWLGDVRIQTAGLAVAMIVLIAAFA